MALRIVANRPDPAILRLPWDRPLEEWDEEFVVPLPRGLSRHIVRIVRLGGRTYAVKETEEAMAFREYGLLRDLQRMNMPSVVPQGVVTGRTTPTGQPLPAALMTQHLRFSLPYRSLFGQGIGGSEQLPLLVDALVVLLVRLHLDDFFWGDVSLSNVLFRRNAGAFAAYLVDAETGELRATLSDAMREYDIEVGCQNVFAELMDLQASGIVSDELDGFAIVELIQERYTTLWSEITVVEEFRADEMWRVEQRIARLNDLGFDVDELDIVTDYDGDTVRISPRVVELGHHARELRDLTGMSVEDNQARRLLNDISSFAAARDYWGEDRALVANRWLNDIYLPVVDLIPAPLRGKLEPAEMYHEVLTHRWHLSEREGREVPIFDAARDFIDHVLVSRPDEAVASVADE